MGERAIEETGAESVGMMIAGMNVFCAEGVEKEEEKESDGSAGGVRRQMRVFGEEREDERETVSFLGMTAKDGSLMEEKEVEEAGGIEEDEERWS